MGRGKFFTQFLSEDLKRTDHVKELGVDRRVILNGYIYGERGLDWVQLAQDRVQWRVLVKVIATLRVPYKAGNFLTG
jgi:hypothetical protein